VKSVGHEPADLKIEMRNMPPTALVGYARNLKGE
jgi:hypothetical protein